MRNGWAFEVGIDVYSVKTALEDSLYGMDGLLGC